MKFRKLAYLGVPALAVGSVFNIGYVHAAGFEKAVLWSGHYAALGDAVSSSVKGSESLFFNPAGLGGAQGLQFSGNISPTFNQFTAPLGGSGANINSSTAVSTPGAIFASYGITPKLGVGVGYYVSGGTRSTFSSVTAFNSSGWSMTPLFQGNLTASEVSLGVGYEILDGLKVGVAYRIVMVNADLSYAGQNPAGSSNLVAVSLSGLSATQYNGFRAGVQYSPKDSHWGLGVDYRTQVQFNATGNSSGLLQVNGSGTIYNLSGSSATVGSNFPQQLDIAGHYDLMPNLRLFLGYTWSEYSEDQQLNVGGVLTGIPVPTGTAIPSIAQNWANMNQYRVALEYSGIQNWPIRAAYVYTSQVTPTTTPNPVFDSPSNGNTITAGTGTAIMPNLEADVALEYSWAGATLPTNLNYAAQAYAIHIGVDYAL